MRKSKLLTFLLTIVFSLGSIGFCFAEGENSKISKDDAKSTAIRTIKDVFGITIDEKKFESRIEYRQDYDLEKEYVWYINYNSHDGEKNMTIDVQVNANTGKVIGFNKYEYGSDRENAVTSITEDEAKKIAEKFIEGINPSEFKDSKFVADKYRDFYGERYYGSSYNFRYIRVVNGIEFERNYIQVEVDGEKGNIVGYNFRWNDNLNVPSSSDAISSEKANEIFKNETKLNLSYIPYRKDPYRSEKPDGIKVAYTQDYSIGNMIDAKKGVLIDYNGKTVEERKVKDLSEKEKESFLGKYKEAVKLNREISKDEANDIIDEIAKDVFGSDYEIESMRYLEGENYWESNGQKAWSGEIVKKGNNNYDDRGEITINALTKEVISIDKYYRGETSENEKPKLSFDEAYYKAIDILAKYFPSEIKEIDTKQYNYGSDYGRDRELYFNFQRNIKGISYNENGININLDKKTGNISSIRATWDETNELPDISKVMGEEKAKDIYVKAHEPKLVYQSINKGEDYSKPDVETIIAYSLDSKYPVVNIDAFNGSFLNFNGEEVKDKDNTFNEKIKGHWAEKTLNILASRNIIDTKDFDLNKDITKIQAIKMIVNAKGYEPYNLRDAKDVNFKDISKDSEEYKYLKMAVKYGLIEDKGENFNPNDKVTRQDMAKLLVNLMGYDKIAKAKDIYSLNFKDVKNIKPENIGYVAVCKGLGVLEGNNGQVRPNDNATMVEMAVSIYKAMANMK